MKVSWYVYADRNDKYMKAYPAQIEVEENKHGGDVGKYIRPELYNQPKEKGIFYRGEYKPAQVPAVPVSKPYVPADVEQK